MNDQRNERQQRHGAGGSGGVPPSIRVFPLANFLSLKQTKL